MSTAEVDGQGGGRVWLPPRLCSCLRFAAPRKPELREETAREEGHRMAGRTGRDQVPLLSRGRHVGDSSHVRELLPGRSSRPHPRPQHCGDPAFSASPWGSPSLHVLRGLPLPSRVDSVHTWHPPRSPLRTWAACTLPGSERQPLHHTGSGTATPSGPPRTRAWARFLLFFLKST